MKNYFVQIDTRLITTKGDQYASLILLDEEGKTISCKLWNTIEVEKLEGKVISANVVDQPYKGTSSWIVERFHITENQSWKFVPPSDVFKDFTIDDLVVELKNKINSIKDEHLKYITETIINENLERFTEEFAAVKIHHAFTGGLLLHTVQVIKMCEYFYNVYTKYFEIDRDVLIAGAILHDVCKIHEYKYGAKQPYMSYIGHISGVIQTIRLVAEGNIGERVEHLIHVIQSHHGKLEFGSPTVPATIEAWILSFADLIDAKFFYFLQLMRENPNEVWIFNNKDFSSLKNSLQK